MATFYLWDSRRAVGHASLHLNDGTYISFHPATDDLRGVFRNRAYEPELTSFNSDLGSYGSCKESVDVPFNFDTERHVSQYWQNHAPKLYSLWSTNCAAVVSKLLMTGFLHEIHGGVIAEVHARLASVGFFDLQGIRHAHGRVPEVAVAVINQVMRLWHANPRGRRDPGAAVLAALGGNLIEEFIPDPGHAYRLAVHIAHHLPPAQEAAQG